MTTPVLYGMPPGLSSMMEKHPQMLLSTHALRNAAISGPSSEHMIAGFVSIDRPWREYSGNTTRSIVGKFRRALATKSTIHWVCTARSVGVTTLGSWSCTTAEDDAVRGLIQASKATGGHDAATKQATFFDTHSIILRVS